MDINNFHFETFDDEDDKACELVSQHGQVNHFEVASWLAGSRVRDVVRWDARIDRWRVLREQGWHIVKESDFCVLLVFIGRAMAHVRSPRFQRIERTALGDLDNIRKVAIFLAHMPGMRWEDTFEGARDDDS